MVPRYLVTVEHAVEADTPGKVAAAVEQCYYPAGLLVSRGVE